MVFLEVKIAVFLFILSFVYLGCSEGILHLNYWSSSSGFFLIISFLFVLMNMLSRCRIVSTGRGGVWCIRRCTIYGVLHGSQRRPLCTLISSTCNDISKLEDTKVIIRNCKSTKNRQYS
jgi:hypothetical protein